MRSGRLARTVVLIATTLMALVVFVPAALAQPYPGGGETPPTVGGERFFRGSEGTARTGVDVLLLLLIALLLLIIGVILHSLNRRTAGSDH